jgi:hypothetical protein
MSYRVTLVLVLLSVVAPPLRAGIIFNRKKDRPDPNQRVPELVGILKNDKDADKRARAAEELRNYDPAAFPDIIPTLIHALGNDQKPAVRIEAIRSLARLRPVSPAVGEALEQTVARDSSMRVCLQARSALLQYYWAGYRGKKNEVPPLKTTREPPLAGGDGHPPAISTTSGQAPVAPLPVPTTQEPPLLPTPPLPPPAPAPKRASPPSSDGPRLDGPPLP